MTVQELRKTKDYIEAINKVKNYPKGFMFNLNYSGIPKAKANALRIIMQDCINNGIVESVSIGISLTGEQIEETYKRL